MYDSESEDVVTENSPLFLHLKETGFLELDNPLKKESNEEFKCEKYTFNAFSSFFQKIIITVKNSSKVFWDSIYKNLLQDFHELEYCTRKEIIIFISKTKLLIDDDQEFLNNFASEILSKYESYNLALTKWRFTPVTILSYFLAGSFAWLSWFISASERSVSYNILDNILIFLIVTVVIGYISQYCIYCHYKKNIEANLSQLKELSDTSINISSLTKKLINIIQEAEIIARGFTFASLKVPTQRLEFSSMTPGTSVKRQYPELRENIFSWIRNMYYRYRQATLNLHQLLPFQPLLPVNSHYLAYTNLDEFGPLLKLSLNNENEKQQLFEASDMFSISSLKSIFQLMEVQQSEFYRLFSLGFVPDTLIEMQHNPLSVLNSFSKIIHYINQIIKDDHKTLSFLRTAYKYYKSLEISYLLSEERNLPKQSKKSPYSTINLTIHSLNLHLRAALKRVYDAEMMMKQIDQDFNSESRLHIDSVLNPCLIEIKSELEASKECLDETEEQLNLLTGKKLPVDSLHIIPPSKSDFQGQELPLIKLFELDEPAVHDQVFEAFTDTVQTEKNRIEDNKMYSKEEKIRMKKEKEASVHLLKELRSVLVAKAEEHKLREEKALIKIRQLNLTEIEQLELNKSLQNTKEKMQCDNQQLEENSSDDSYQGNQTDKSIETLKEADEIERWELLTDKELHLTDNDKISLTECSNLENDEIASNITLHIDNSASFASSIAALAAERCKNLGLQIQTFSTNEGDECFGNDDDNDENN